MTWEDEFKGKFIAAEEAAKMVKSGDWVVLPMGRAPYALGSALAVRKEELKDVHVFDPTPSYDFGWYDPGWEDSFKIYAGQPMPLTEQMFEEKRCEIPVPGLNIWQEVDMLPPEAQNPDVVFVEISPPDSHGFCSFGASLWNKKQVLRKAKLKFGEVNQRLIRTHGDNFIHFSEFDYFVEHTRPGEAGSPGTKGSLAGRMLKEPAPYLPTMAGYVRELIRDGDTLQLGVSRTIEPMIMMGMLEGKQDLGWHSEATIRGVIRLVREGVMNGSKKTINTGLCVTTAVGGDTREEMEWVNDNPLFYLVDSGYIWDVRVIAAHDNFVSINAAAMVDVTGQITAERVGYHILGGAGGQLPFVIGSWMSRGGRVIHVMPSTANTKDGLISRIVVDFPVGTLVTQHRQASQFVVTEYGIANLMGKTIRQRVEELISVAHPDFRAELMKRAREIYWP
ncbi:MAG: hypothetical protein JSW38_05725 [Dehalococcoidia bacterium]|nr:MAG: hypothetical protein JSW38_05725 [Dehalococcoidia bacterium]